MPSDAEDGTTLKFELTVTDLGGDSDTDSVTAKVKVAAPETPTPTACAGDDLTGNPGDEVTLQGTCSVNPYGEWWLFQHQWTQLSGPSVTLTHSKASLLNQAPDKFGDPSFTLPADAEGGITLEFQLTVTDKEGVSDTDTVTVTVE